MTLIQAILVLGGAGLVFGALLAFAAQRFRVETDPRVDQIKDIMPGANCGGCGFPGCGGLAEAIVIGKSSVSACPVGGPELSEQIARIMGVEVDSSAVRKIAIALCGGGDNCNRRYDYGGLRDCQAALAGPGLSGGEFACENACLGYGNCVQACMFDALFISEQGLPIVIAENCTGCGRCVEACPRGVMALVPETSRVHVRCRNDERGAAVKKKCSNGCLGCKVCVKKCPEEALIVEDNVARIDYSICSNCGECAGKCPTGAIVDLDADKRELAAS